MFYTKIPNIGIWPPLRDNIIQFGERNGHLLQYLYLGNAMDKGAWRATLHGVAKRVRRDLLTSHSSNLISITLLLFKNHICLLIFKKKVKQYRKYKEESENNWNSNDIFPPYGGGVFQTSLSFTLYIQKYTYDFKYMKWHCMYVLYETAFCFWNGIVADGVDMRSHGT